MIPFTAFSPDLDQTTPGIITSVTNMIPTLRGYAGGPSGADVGMDALASAALAAAVLTKLDGTNRTIAGAATKLYEKSGSTWVDVSRVAAYNASVINPWRFAQFGNTSLAINKGDVLQSSNSGAFDDLTAPKAATMCVSNGFVVLANTNEATYSDSPDRWWCSAYLDVTDWVPDIATQCTTGQLVETPGAITAVRTLGEYVIAYKERSMYVGRYAGPPSVFNFQLVPGEIGCASHEAIADIGTAHIFIGNEDIYIFDGSHPVPIGTPLREWFFNDLDPAYRYRVRHGIDRANSLVFFYYPRVSGGGALDGCIVYNYKSNKWGVSHRSIECVVDYITGGYTYNTLPIIDLTWNDWPQVQYDSPYWTASARYIAYIGMDHTIYSLTGVAGASSLTTGDYGVENEYTLLDRVTLRYLQKPTTATMTNFYQEYHGGAWIEDTTTTEDSGRFDVLRSAPWHKVTFNFTGDVEVTAANASVTPDGVL